MYGPLSVAACKCAVFLGACVYPESSLSRGFCMAVPLLCPFSAAARQGLPLVLFLLCWPRVVLIYGLLE
jgi:hypothetical protein